MERSQRNIVIAGAALALAAVAFVLWWTTVHRLAREAVAPREDVIDLTSLVTQVRGLNRLETASMRVVHVGTISQTYKLVPDVLGGDELTLLATGDVIAGVDLSQFRASDVRRQPDGTIVLRLPPARILITRVDNGATHVVSRKTGVLRRADQGLETRARQHAEAMIRGEALRKGIIKLADDNAEKRMADFLHTVGFEKVQFIRSGEALPRPGPV